MANALYDAGRDAFANGNIDWVNDTIKAVLVDDADYTVSLSTHEDLADIAAAARVSTGTLAGKSTSAGVVDASNLVLSTVSGDQSEALVIYKDTGVEGTSTLIAYIDNASGLPIDPNGGDITIEWDDGANKIFKL